MSRGDTQILDRAAIFLIFREFRTAIEDRTLSG
jgi:hypothetical protein